MEFVEHTKSAEYCPTYPLLWKTGLFKMFLMLFHNRSKQVNVKSLALFWIIIHQTKRLKWDVFGDFFLPLLKTNMFGSETDDTQGPRHSFMFLRQHDGLMFRLLHLSQTPKTGALGALRFHPTLCFSAQLQSHRYGDGANEQGGKCRSPLCPLQRFVWDRIHFGFWNSFPFYVSRSNQLREN